VGGAPRDKRRFHTDCLICRRSGFSYLGSHVFRAHGITAHEYRVEFGLSTSDVLIDQELSERMAVIHHEHLKEIRSSTDPDTLLAMFARANAIKRAATHCSYGHEFSGDNVRWDGTLRRCKKCDARRQREYKARKKSLAVES
jgi:hypothetical protein